MALSSKPIKTLDDLFVHTLEDMSDTEQAIAKPLPKMAQKAGQAELRQAFEKHLDETRNQIARLEPVFKMHGIIEEAEELISDVGDAEVLDAG
jgi:ferritin-like metal-binding protein YciE